MQVLVARQAIFDRSQSVVAYELLYRPSAPAGEAMRGDDLATFHVISSLLWDIGPDQMLDGRRGFINVPESLLNDQRLRSLPVQSVGFEILESTKPTADALDACRVLREEGFVLALDDFTGQESLRPFLSLVDWVKVDFRESLGILPKPLEDYRTRRSLRLLAEKVENEAEFRRAANAGYSYFQGFFLERPKLLTGERLPAGARTRLELLQALARPELELRKIENLVTRDPGLCYRLLKFVNSARFSHSTSISSVRQALVHLGELELRRWVSLVLLPELAAGRPKHLLSAAVVRARMCELTALEAGLAPLAPQAFLTGMLSLLEAILMRPMQQIADELKLPEMLRAVLVEESPDCDLTHLLAAARSYEHADWHSLIDLAEVLHTPVERLAEAYLSSVRWARSMAVAS